MPALTPKLLYKEKAGLVFAVYQVTNASNGDTISVSADFSRVITTATFNITRSQTYDAGSISGTTITLDEAASANDDLRVVVIGSAA